MMVKPGDCIHCGKELCNDLGWCNSFKAADDLKTAALLCPSSGIGSSNVLRVVNCLAQIRAERLHLEAYAAGCLALQGVQSVT